MSNVFSAARFGKYFRRELRGAYQGFGLSTLIIGLLPIVFFVFFQLIYHLASGGEWGSAESNIVNRFSCFLAVFVSAVLSFPSKVYGHITDKRAGTSYLMLPVSTFEKWLSLVLTGCVVLPLAVGVLYFGSDFILGKIFPDNYGTPLLGASIAIAGESATMLDYIGYAIPILWISWTVNILFFTLGALWFKKNKAVKTMLVMIAIGTVCSILFTKGLIAFFSVEDVTDGMILTMLSRTWNLVWIVNGTEAAALAALIYWRLRTIKH